MRIARVACAFFSIGFVAGSFESAASLGYAERWRASQEREVGAAVASSTAMAMAGYGTFGGLPEELLARPLNPPREVPDEVAAGLMELLAESPPAARVSPVLYAPQALGPVVPDRRRPRFGARRAMSAPDRVPLTGIPPPLSFPPPLPLEEPLPFGASKPPQPEPRAPEVAAPEFIMPFDRGRVTSLFHQGRYHPAIDLAGRLGSTVHATTRHQRVTFTGWRNGYGYTVVTRDGTGRQHLYAHLQRVLTRVGAILDQGQALGRLGSTGRSTGPHVHYEVKTRVGAHINPVTLLFPGRRVGRGFAWNGARSVTRLAGRPQPRPR
jgi:murein DD-endopeptidase MepM/ murein hydrolase activator NlpD